MVLLCMEFQLLSHLWHLHSECQQGRIWRSFMLMSIIKNIHKFSFCGNLSFIWITCRSNDNEAQVLTFPSNNFRIF